MELKPAQMIGLSIAGGAGSNVIGTQINKKINQRHNAHRHYERRPVKVQKIVIESPKGTKIRKGGM